MKYWHLTLLTILLISLPAIGFNNYAIVKRASDELHDANREQLVGTADALEGHLEEYFADRQAMLGAIASDPEVVENGQAIVEDFYGGSPVPEARERVSSIVDRFTYSRVGTFSVVMLDRDHGAIVLSPSDPSLEGYIPLNASNVQGALERTRVLYLPSLPWEATPCVIVTHPVTATGGGTVAVLAGFVTGLELERVLYSHHGLGRDGGIYLVGSDGRLLTTSPDGEPPGTMAHSSGATKALGGSSGFIEKKPSDSPGRLEAYEALEKWDLALVVEQDWESANVGVKVVQYSAMAATVIVAGALVVIAGVFTKSLVRDLSSLVSWSKRIGKGDLEADLHLGPTDEFKELEGAFHKMVRDLMKHQAQLRQAERRFANLFMTSLDPVYIATADGRIAELNKSGEAVLGLPRLEDGTFGYSLEELFSSDEARQEFIGRLEREGAVAGFEANLVLPSGRELFVLISATRRLDPLGRTMSYQGVIHDITDRKHFEEALIKAKNEAEFYCDIMSHDLNNAVQGLGGYLELCNMASCLDDVNKFLPYAHEQMSRASDLLRNVRRLSRMGSQKVELHEVDLRKLIERSLWSVERMHPHDDIDMRVTNHGEDPRVLGEAFLEDVFINLLDNAVKYDAHNTKLVDVDIARMETDGSDEWRVRVADRGPGIADRDKLTIFGRFERRALNEYGTGLGLSIVVKAVERCGGRIWVEDRVEGDHKQGAAFVVELQAA